MSAARAVMVALMLAAASAVAEPGDALKAAQAEQLFREARTLMDTGDYAAARTKLEASHKLDPALGTLMNLARCNEQLGKTASAWAQYLEVAGQARRAGDLDRADVAQDFARKLEPKLVRLRIEVAVRAREQGIQVALGGEGLDSALLDATIPYDPGQYEISATAAGYRPWRRVISVTAEGQVVTVEIPALEAEPVVAETAPPQTAPADPPLALTVGPTLATVPAPADEAPPTHGGLRWAAWTASGLGLGAVVLGSGFGLSARTEWSDAEELGCADGTCPTATAQAHSDRAGRRANASTGAFVVGGVLLATGVVLHFVHRGKQRRASLRHLPAVGPGVVGVAF